MVASVSIAPVSSAGPSMAVEIFAFQPRKGPVPDWTQEELAQLYRVDHALVQSGLLVEHDRGRTDEGDPWFVFCRPDGEVLIHLTRYDGLYRLHSPALPEPLVGRSFVELTKSFTDQAAMQVVIRRTRPAHLYVHPASMLAVIVGTIFLAAQDVLPAEGTPDAAKKGGNGDAVAAHPLKTQLQSTFQSYFDAIVSWARDANPVQQAVGFGVISTLTAVLTGLTDGLTHNSSGELSAQASSIEHHPQDHLTYDTQLAVHSGALGLQDNATLSIKALGLSAERPSPTGTTSSTTSSSETAAPDHSSVAKSNAPINYPDNGWPDSGAVQPQETPKAFDHSPSFDGPSVDVNAAHTPGSSLLKSTAEQAVSASIAANANSTSLTSSSMVVNDILTTLSVASSSAVSQNSFADINNLLAHATPVNFQNSDWDFLFRPGSSSTSITTAASSNSAEPALPVATPFDDHAAESLETFLKANPQARAVFDNKSIVIYEAPEASHANDAILNIWDFPDGSTITLIGTADHPHALV